MTTPALVPDLTGKPIYTTPSSQSPTAHPIHDQFTNPKCRICEDAATKDEEFESSTTAIKSLSQIGSNGSPPANKSSPEEIAPIIPPRPFGRRTSIISVEDEKPEVPPRPVGREIPLVSKVEKEAPPLPIRPPNHSTRTAPEPIPDIPQRAAPTPFKQRNTLPPPTIPEEPNEQIGDPPVKYSRQPEKLMAYLIPLPNPNLKKRMGREDDLPQRYLLYTPPKPHCLKPAEGVKETKRHKGRRKLQEQVEKAKKYDGKTFSWRGLHSKTTKGVLWAVRRIRATDLVFLGRIKNKEVDEIVLVYPDNITQTIPEVRNEFIAQVTRTKKRAAKESVISTLLLPVALVIDTIAVVIWPFGGLLEIDAVWCYAATKGWHTSRRITKRLGTRQSRFNEYGGKERDLFLRYHQDADMEVLQRYVAEACHKMNPAMFDSVGVPPTETEVAKAIGWRPVLRGKTGELRREGDGEGFMWADEEWQRAVFADDLKAVAEKGARSWEGWGRRFEKKPDKALKK
ncbi:uncharacterized protein RAG0_10957 [Rhynchosporium agropyri]|uniref:Uncharacterized protein n=1 Tax=Rhynchosporium agropyri TaxID=914238 RepID=A0A1E1L205_9HELO|nr:uncharacterized protein RAG0_10957 [Rhynchosporium agropyri]